MRFCAKASSIWMSSFDAMLFANLLLEHFPVKPALPDQFLVCPALDDAALLQHEDLVRVMHRRKTLRDHKRGAPLASRRIAVWIKCSVAGSTLAVASSRIRMRGFIRKALAIATRCR